MRERLVRFRQAMRDFALLNLAACRSKRLEIHQKE